MSDKSDYKFNILVILQSVILILAVALIVIVFKNTFYEPDTIPEETLETTFTASEETESVINTNMLFEDLQSGMSVCFAGDSITYGSAEGVTWYEPIMPLIQGSVSNFSNGGWTSQTLLEIDMNVPEADIYVVAIGLNDILFIDQPLGAASADEYIDNLRLFEEQVKIVSPDARMYFITPWPFLDGTDEANATRTEFFNALKNWCNGEDRICIDPYNTIMDVLENSDTDAYMWNEYHPNSTRGVNLYSYAVLQQESLERGFITED